MKRITRPLILKWRWCNRLQSRGFSSRDSDSDVGRRDAKSNIESFSTNVLKVAIIGVPNVGKSSLINKLVDRNIFAESRKCHTTRCHARAVLNEENTQLVFLDTPGLVTIRESIKHSLEKSFLIDSELCTREADVVGVMHDVSNKCTRDKLDRKILHLLHLYPDKHTFLILNKVDAIKSKKILLDCAKILTNGHQYKADSAAMVPFSKTEQQEMESESGWSYFKDIFMVSALNGDGTDDLKMYLLNHAKPGDWIFPEDVYTDQDDQKMIQDLVFSKLLDELPNRIPYNLKVQIEYLNEGEDGTITSVVLVGVENKRISGLIRGRGGARIKSIAKTCEQDLRKLYQTDFRLRLVLAEKRKVGELVAPYDDKIQEESVDKICNF